MLSWDLPKGKMIAEAHAPVLHTVCFTSGYGDNTQLAVTLPSTCR